jgi:hypothetical protein
VQIKLLAALALTAILPGLAPADAAAEAGERGER